MTYTELVAGHAAIKASARKLRNCVASRHPRAKAAAALLQELALLLLEHIDGEAPLFRSTREAAAGDRHAELAARFEREFQLLRESWSACLSRWTGDRIAADWSGFAAESRAMLATLEERLECEASVLYSLALHYRVIAP
ncbi:hypothetical protein [Sphingomonas aracearum]|uniref:Hemerythrin-like domain-containing protein n=1 Tax=Sphingomonas aracearum TaxID=2283317 RepID=A0A369W0E9_9SPHN|nr:hypothetical protein [Sphingomonas aracearum]RDE06840.1 hypothetical protein DVW87_03950 [Sphingomonas aracearum]